MQNAIHKLNNDRSPGPEILKTEGKETSHILQQLIKIQGIWTKGDIPDGWTKIFPRKVTLETATTGVGSQYSTLLARSLAASFYSV